MKRCLYFLGVFSLGCLFCCSYEGGYEAYMQRLKAYDIEGEEYRNVPQFSRLLVSGQCNVVIDPEIDAELKIAGPKIAIDELSTEVINGALVVKHDPYIEGDNLFTITVRNDSLKEVWKGGIGTGYFEGNFKTEDSLKLFIGGASVILSNAKYLDAHVWPSSANSFAGSCDKLVLNTGTDEGEVNASGMKARTAEVHFKGKGGVLVSVEDYLEAHVKGSGYIKYVGDPKVSKTVWGTGDVISY